MLPTLPTVHRSAFAARVCRLLQRGRASAAAISNPIGEMFEGPSGNVFPTRVETTGGMRTVYDAVVARMADDKILIFASGLRAFHAQTFLGGYGNYTAMSRDAYGFNTASFTDATTILHNFVQRAGQRPADYYLYGYSAGGVLVEAYAKYLRTTGVRTIKEIVTFGAPKPAGQGDIVEGTRINRVRWMNVGDPVPAIPMAGVGGALSIALKDRKSVV